MSPEEREQFKNEIIEEIMNTLGNHSTVPLDVENALKRRFNLTEVPAIETGSKSATAENQAVNEGGAGLYDVLGIPDRFRLLKTSKGEVIGYVPIYD